MRPVDSAALTQVARSLQIGSGQGETEFHEELLQQVLDVSELVRRGMALPGARGIITGAVKNIHGAGGVVSTSINPYSVGNTARQAPYPAQVDPDRFDLFLLGATMVRQAGTGTAVGVLRLAASSVPAGFGIDSAAAAVSGGQLLLAHFPDNVTITGTVTFGTTGTGRSYAPIGVRLPDSNLVWITEASAASEWQVNMLLGMFPAGLGQDVGV